MRQTLVDRHLRLAIIIIVEFLELNFVTFWCFDVIIGRIWGECGGWRERHQLTTTTITKWIQYTDIDSLSLSHIHTLTHIFKHTHRKPLIYSDDVWCWFLVSINYDGFHLYLIKCAIFYTIGHNQINKRVSTITNNLHNSLYPGTQRHTNTKIK